MHMGALRVRGFRYKLGATQLRALANVSLLVNAPPFDTMTGNQSALLYEALPRPLNAHTQVRVRGLGFSSYVVTAAAERLYVCCFPFVFSCWCHKWLEEEHCMPPLAPLSTSRLHS